MPQRIRSELFLFRRDLLFGCVCFEFICQALVNDPTAYKKKVLPDTCRPIQSGGRKCQRAPFLEVRDALRTNVILLLAHQPFPRHTLPTTHPPQKTTRSLGVGKVTGISSVFLPAANFSVFPDFGRIPVSSHPLAGPGLAWWSMDRAREGISREPLRRSRR